MYIGCSCSKEALPILCVRCAWWKREREREREKERQTDRRKWRHHCRAKIGDECTLSLTGTWRERRKWRHHWHAKIGDKVYTFPCQKFAHGDEFTIFLCQKFEPFVSPFTLSISPFLNGHHCGAKFRNEFSLSVAKKIRPLCSAAD